MTVPSEACQTCKSRRIKCDGTKPVCQRCTKSKRICIAAKTIKQANFSIHVENTYASGKKKRPRGPRPSTSITCMNFDLETRALGFYLQYHLLAMTDFHLAGCLSQCVSAWHFEGPSCPMVDLAVSAMALAVFSRIQKYSPAAVEASSKYQSLIRLMRTNVAQVGTESSNQRDIDALLLVTTLMGRYENVLHRPSELDLVESFRSLHTWSHHDGTIAILKKWYDTRASGTTTEIIKQTRRSCLKSYFLRSLLVPDWIADGSLYGEEGLDLEYDRLVIRLINLRHYGQKYRPVKPLQISEIDHLNRKACAIDNDLNEWALKVSKASVFKQHFLTDSDLQSKDHFYSSTNYSYSAPADAALWSDYFATQMLVNAARLKILELAPKESSDELGYERQREDCINKMQTMADNLASTVPFCLGRFVSDPKNSNDPEAPVSFKTNEEVKPYLAHLVVWPLTLGASAEGIDIMQQKWFRSELSKMGNIVGDGVVACAYHPQWTTLLEGDTPSR